MHVQRVAGDAGAEHHQTDACDGESHDDVGRVDGDLSDHGGERDHRHGRHAGEVQRHDAENHQQNGCDLSGKTGAIESQGAEHDRADHRGDETGALVLRAADEILGRLGVQFAGMDEHPRRARERRLRCVRQSVHNSQGYHFTG